jgi:NADH-quinone oxidoreductase subunit A
MLLTSYEYFTILNLLIISVVLTVAMVVVNLLLSPYLLEVEKGGAYECGFDPFDDSRLQFSVQYYVLAILFLLFDLEIIFLFPWAVGASQLPVGGFWVVMAFLFIVTAGFVYEWQKGALEWRAALV